MSHDLNDTLIFVKVVEMGSFIGAARALRLPKTTVSRKVQELEERLGAQLLHRTTRKLGVTEAGSIYFEHCQRIARELEEAESAVGQLQNGPRGWLRVTAPYSLGIERLAPLLGQFHRMYPDLRVEMELSNDSLDLIDRGIDVALRIGELPDSNLIARPLAHFRSQVYASPDYVAAHGEPHHPDELLLHRTLGFQQLRRNGNYYWPLSDGGPTQEFRIEPIMVANDPGALRGALLSGEGIMLNSEMMVKGYIQLGYLRRVLPGWVGPKMPLNAVFPRGRMQSPKVRVFVDFLLERFSLDADYMLTICPDMCHRLQMEPDRNAASPVEQLEIYDHLVRQAETADTPGKQEAEEDVVA